MNGDKAKKLVEQGFADLETALKAGRSDTLAKFLTVMSKFHRYSWNNCLLIALQRPDASYVAGFRKWLELKRYVRKGEKGIAILAPMVGKKKADDKSKEEDTVRTVIGFRTVYVFDISQTEGEDLPDFAKIQGEPGDLVDRLEAVVQSDGIELRFEEMPPGTSGMSHKGAITLATGLSPAERFSVLVHEFAHERIHAGERRQETSKTVRETEAEAISFVVCQAFGLDCSTRSSDYIQLYSGDSETLSESLDLIRKTAQAIIEQVSSENSEEVAA